MFVSECLAAELCLQNLLNKLIKLTYLFNENITRQNDGFNF